MPIYDYACERCGPFAAMRPMARFRDPCDCPRCGSAASRTWVEAPAIGRGDPNGRRTGASAASPAPTAHPSGCGCCMRRVPLPAALSDTGRVFTANGPVRRPGP